MPIDERDEINEEDLEEIARLVREGYTNGILYPTGYRIAWSINIDKSKND